MELDHIAPDLRQHAREIVSLREDKANARKHSERNIEAIKQSLVRFGQQKPIVVTSDGIVKAGNGTLRAAWELGWTHLAAITTDLDNVRGDAFAVADNRIAELAEWYQEGLIETLQHIGEEQEDLLPSLGFSDSELRMLLEEPEMITPGGLSGGRPPSDKSECPRCGYQW